MQAELCQAAKEKRKEIAKGLPPKRPIGFHIHTDYNQQMKDRQPIPQLGWECVFQWTSASEEVSDVASPIGDSVFVDWSELPGIQHSDDPNVQSKELLRDA